MFWVWLYYRPHRHSPTWKRLTWRKLSQQYADSLAYEAHRSYEHDRRERLELAVHSREQGVYQITKPHQLKVVKTTETARPLVDKVRALNLSTPAGGNLATCAVGSRKLTRINTDGHELTQIEEPRSSSTMLTKSAFIRVVIPVHLCRLFTANSAEGQFRVSHGFLKYL